MRFGCVMITRWTATLRNESFYGVPALDFEEPSRFGFHRVAAGTEYNKERRSTVVEAVG